MKVSRINPCKLCFGKLKEISSMNLSLSKFAYFLLVNILGVRLGEYSNSKFLKIS